MYELIRPLLFTLDPEQAHELGLRAMEISDLVGFTNLLSPFFKFESPRLEVNCFGLKFSNPIGLAAGLDKQGQAVPFLSSLGFGHLELGTVTLLAQPGNPRPRIFRLTEDQALINRMGFPSKGAEDFRSRMLKLNSQAISSKIGINIGKSKVTELDLAAEDYRKLTQALHPYANYFTVNVSSPNTPELRKLQEPKRLAEIFAAIEEVNLPRKPVLVKISPDLSQEQLAELLACLIESKIDGVIATNTTLRRDNLISKIDQTGGLSGQPLKGPALEMVRFIAQESAGKLVIIGVGGIYSAQDAWDYLQAGASLLQIYTGLIYQGPTIVKEIKKGLLKLMDDHAIVNIEQIKKVPNLV